MDSEEEDAAHEGDGEAEDNEEKAMGGAIGEDGEEDGKDGGDDVDGDGMELGLDGGIAVCSDNGRDEVCEAWVGGANKVYVSSDGRWKVHIGIGARENDRDGLPYEGIRVARYSNVPRKIL